jgi:hypothetical protein
MSLFHWKTECSGCKELRGLLLSLVRKIDDKDLDWADMRARCKRLLDRTEKAAARVAAGEPDVSSEVQQDNPQANGEGNHQPGRMLSPHQLSIQQAILRRRGGA